MLYEERSEIIISLLEQKNTVSTKELIKILKVSEATVRRDLDSLEDEGKISRVHGGAILRKFETEEDNVEKKSISNILEKNQVAKTAASLIKDKEFIYLDAGTTTFAMIPYLKGKDITVVTNGLSHIDELLKNKINSYLIGGHIKESTRALVGSIALNNLESVNFSKVFIGANGVDLKFGFTTPDIEEARLKSKAIENAVEAYILADNSKFGKVYFSKIVGLDSATIITDNIEVVSLDVRKKTKVIGG